MLAILLSVKHSYTSGLAVLFFTSMQGALVLDKIYNSALIIILIIHKPELVPLQQEAVLYFE